MHLFALLTFLLSSSHLLASALPASNPPPTTLIQTASNTSNSPPNPFTTRFPIPNTSTTLWLTSGHPVPPSSLSILLSRAQNDLESLIAHKGPHGIPGDVNAPQYSYLTTTPAGLQGYFFVSGIKKGGLTYGLCEDVLVGLKMYLLEGGRNEGVVFEVEERGQEEGMEAFGGVAVVKVGGGGGSGGGIGGDGVEGIGNGNKTVEDPHDPPEISLHCTFSRPLPSSGILQVLLLARLYADSQIREHGADAYLPGEWGQWGKDGDFGASFLIQGVPPHRMIWGVMKGVVERLKDILVEQRVNRETECNVEVEGEERGKEVVGVVSIKGVV